MTRISVILLFVVIIISACAANSQVPVVVPETQTQPGPLTKSDFVPTDPKNVNLVTGRPQLIEFFAFW